MSGESGFMYQVGQTLTSEDVAEMERAALTNGENTARLHRKLDGRGDQLRSLIRAILNVPDKHIDAVEFDELVKDSRDRCDQLRDAERDLHAHGKLIMKFLREAFDRDDLELDAEEFPASVDAACDAFSALRLRVENAERDSKATVELRERDVNQRDRFAEELKTAEADVKRLTVEAQASQRNSDRADASAEKAKGEVVDLMKIVNDDNAVCICGCPQEDHEQYEEGESCEDETHECLRVSLGVKRIVDKLKLDLEVAEAVARPGSPLPCGHPQHLAFSYDHHGKKIDCLMCLVVRLTDAVKPLAAFSTSDMVQVSAGNRVITGADAQIAACTVKDSKAAQAFYAKRVVDGSTPDCATSPPCTGCEDLEDTKRFKRVCLDLHEALGVQWGEDPYAAIKTLKDSEDDRVDEAEVPVEADKPGDLDYCACGGAERIAELKKALANTMRYNQTAPTRLAEIEPQFDAAKLEVRRLKLIEKDVELLTDTILKLRREAKTLGSDKHELEQAYGAVCERLQELGEEAVPLVSSKDERIKRLEAKLRGHLRMDAINAKILLVKRGGAYSLEALGSDMRSALACFEQGHGATLEDQD